MQYGIGGTAHCHIQRHGVNECIAGGNVPWKNTVVAVAVIFPGIFYNYRGCIHKELFAVDVCCHDGSVTGQCQPDCFVQAIHGIGCKHARTRSASGTSSILHPFNLFVGDIVVGSQYHCVHQIQLFTIQNAGFHRTSRHKNCRDVQSHGSHEHARGYLIAVADADHRICFVCIHHVFHTVGYEVTRGK